MFDFICYVLVVLEVLVVSTVFAILSISAALAVMAVLDEFSSKSPQKVDRKSSLSLQKVIRNLLICPHSQGSKKLLTSESFQIFLNIYFFLHLHNGEHSNRKQFTVVLTVYCIFFNS